MMRKRNRLRRTLALLMTVLLLVTMSTGVLAAEAAPGTMPVDKPAASGVPTEDAKTEIPEVTETPEITKTQEATETPEPTKTPEAIETRLSPGPRKKRGHRRQKRRKIY